MQSVLHLMLLSFPAGFLIGLTGIGGAALMTPLLILILGTKPHVAVGTDLAYATITKALGATVHWRLHHVDLPVVWQLAAGSVPGGIVGTLAGTGLGRESTVSEVALRMSIGIVVLIAAIVLSFQHASPKLALDGSPKGTVRRRAIGTIAYGVVVGFAVGLTSVGSGALILPFLLVVHRLSVGRAVGTDVLHGAILTSVTASFYTALGSVQWELIPGLLAGSIPGVILGSLLAPRLPRPILQFILVPVLLIAAYNLII